MRGPRKRLPVAGREASKRLRELLHRRTVAIEVERGRRLSVRVPTRNGRERHGEHGGRHELSGIVRPGCVSADEHDQRKRHGHGPSNRALFATLASPADFVPNERAPMRIGRAAKEPVGDQHRSKPGKGGCMREKRRRGGEMSHPPRNPVGFHRDWEQPPEPELHGQPWARHDHRKDRQKRDEDRSGRGNHGDEALDGPDGEQRQPDSEGGHRGHLDDAAERLECRHRCSLISRPLRERHARPTRRRAKAREEPGSGRRPARRKRGIDQQRSRDGCSGKARHARPQRDHAASAERAFDRGFRMGWVRDDPRREGVAERPGDDGAHRERDECGHENSTITGAWSEGDFRARSCRSTTAPIVRSASLAVQYTWSMRSPLPRSKPRPR